MIGVSRLSMNRIGKVLREETGIGQGRLWLINLLGQLLPAGVGGRLRARLYRALGIAIGEGTIVHGPICFAASGSSIPSITIGKRCFINAHVYLDASAPIHLGDGVSLGHHVTIVTADHTIGSPQFRAGELHASPVTIGEGAWIAAGALLLPGVTIGAGAIVAAGAVVTRNVTANTLVGGVPARAIKLLPT